MVKFQRRGQTTLNFLPSTFNKMGGQDEEQKKDESFKSSPQEKECQEITEKVEGGKKVPYLIH